MIDQNKLNLAIKDIDHLFEIGEWCNNPRYPQYQTWPHLFDINKNIWIELKQSFVSEIEKYGYTKDQYDIVECWSYVNFSGYPFSYPNWHSHYGDRSSKRTIISGVMYLSENARGTMFKLSDDSIIETDGTPGIWNIFLPEQIHSPPPWDQTSKNNRYSLAAGAVILL